jgi:hypothetical protein
MDLFSPKKKVKKSKVAPLRSVRKAVSAFRPGNAFAGNKHRYTRRRIMSERKHAPLVHRSHSPNTKRPAVIVENNE